MRITRDDFSFSMPSAFTQAGAGNATRSSTSPIARLQAAVAWVVDMPRRRAVIDELAALSDHELADIGLIRSDLKRVFDPAFSGRRSV